jgi:putative endonuclease
MKKGFVYIMASKRNGTTYIGVTSDLQQRVQQHKDHTFPGFTARHNVTMLVFYEEFNDIRDALAAEKRYKVWQRKWKIRIIEEANPDWEDLSLQDSFLLL